MKKIAFFIIFSSMLSSSVFAQQEFYLLIGTYTAPKGTGEGIYVYKFKSTNGLATYIGQIKSENSSYLTISNNKQFVYAVNQNGNNLPNEVSAFKLNNKTGSLEFINKQNVKSDGPCYITVNKGNNWIFTANYFSGNVSVLPILKDGSIDSIRQLIQHNGSSILKNRQSEAHAHTCVLDEKEQNLWVTDLGTDKIHYYPFNAKENQPLTIDTTKFIQSNPGNGPRHLTIIKNNLYVINELAGTIDYFKVKKNGNQLIQTISTDSTNNLDKGSADIHISNDGKYLYATNRGKYNSISTYAIHKNGTLSLKQVLSTNGKTPRNFIIDPTDNYVLIANQTSNNISIFKRDKKTGLLTYTNQEIKVGAPVCLQMTPVVN